jgi:hypothetical protein
MSRILIIILSAIFCTGTSNIRTIVTDGEYEKMLIGNWWGASLLEEGSVRLYGESAYLSDKTSNGIVVLQKVEKNKYTEIDRLEYKCSWKVESGVLITYDFIENGKKTKRPPIKDKILKINANKAVLKDLLDSSTFELYRMK